MSHRAYRARVLRDVETVLGRLRVQVRGSGPAVLLWPSLLMDRTLWDAQVEALAPRWTTVALDPPGHGDSAPLTRAFTLRECADALVQVLDALELPRAHLVGNSWGAMVAATTAAVHPERVGACVLLNGTATAASARQRVEYAALLRLARLLGGLRPPLTGAVVRAFLGPTSRRTRPDVVARVVEAAGRVSVASVAHAVRSVVPRRPDQRALLAAVRAPVLVVAGREDTVFPVMDAERLAAAVPGARLVVLEDAAHLVALELPEVVTRLVEEFLAEYDLT